MAYGLQTYDAQTRREDLLDIITDVSPDETPLSTMFGTTSASQTLHEWSEDYISRPTSVSTAIEGAAATYADLTEPSRRNNVTQIITETFRVSGTHQTIDIAGIKDPMQYQSEKALRTLKMKLEYSLIQASRASGASGVARQMAGIQNIVTSHYTNRNSGTSLSETEFNDMVYDVAVDVSTANIPDLVLLPLRLRQKLSTFTAGSTKYVDAKDKRLTRPVMVYESDFGVHRIFAHKDVRNAAATPGPEVHLLKEDTWKVAYLRKPFKKPLADDGDRSQAMYILEATLEFRAERSNARRTGYNQSG